MNIIKYYWHLKKLHHAKDSIRRKFDPLRTNAVKEGADRGSLENLAWEERTELTIVDDEIQQLETRCLHEAAHYLMVPIPKYEEDSGKWKESEVQPGRYYLSREGIAELRAAVRNERRERREAAVVWFAAIAGIIGTITGLVAVFKS